MNFSHFYTCSSFFSTNPPPVSRSSLVCSPLSLIGVFCPSKCNLSVIYTIEENDTPSPTTFNFQWLLVMIISGIIKCWGAQSYSAKDFKPAFGRAPKQTYQVQSYMDCVSGHTARSNTGSAFASEGLTIPPGKTSNKQEMKAEKQTSTSTASVVIMSGHSNWILY